MDAGYRSRSDTGTNCAAAWKADTLGAFRHRVVPIYRNTTINSRSSARLAQLTPPQASAWGAQFEGDS